MESLHEVHTTRVIFTVKICIFERSNEKNHFSKTQINFYKKTTLQLLEHIGLQNMKVGVKTNFGRLATIFQICSMDADILSFKTLNLRGFITSYSQSNRLRLILFSNSTAQGRRQERGDKRHEISMISIPWKPFLSEL